MKSITTILIVLFTVVCFAQDTSKTIPFYVLDTAIEAASIKAKYSKGGPGGQTAQGLIKAE